LRAEESVILSFKGVEIATPSFIDEILVRAGGVLRAVDGALLITTGLNDEVGDTLRLVLEHRKMMLAAIDDEHIELLGGAKQLQETFQAAHRLKEFTGADLAKELKVKLPNLHQRLKALESAGAVAKRRDDSATRGKRYVWKTANRKDLADAGERLLA